MVSTILCMRLIKSVEEAVITPEPSKDLPLKTANPVALVEQSSASSFIF